MTSALMADTTFTWAIANLDRKLADGMVTAVHYTVSAHDGTYSSSAYGSVGLEPATKKSMIPFANLEQSVVVEWVKKALGGDEKVQEIQAALQEQIDLQRTPVIGSGVPWNS